jgi:hypothetical protein
MFDPYHKWLGIPRDQRPPNYYQLLGVSPDEKDPEVIEEVALMRIAHLRNYQLGPHAEECSRLLRELGEASETLCDPEKRAAYDAKTLPRHEIEPDSHPEIDDITAASRDEVQRAPAPPFTPAPPEPRETIPPKATFDFPSSGRSGPPERVPPVVTPQPTPPRRVPAHRPEDKLIQELSSKALSELRRPPDPEEETFAALVRRLFEEWREQLPPWWPTFLRRAGVALVLVALSVVVFYLVKSLSIW